MTYIDDDYDPQVIRRNSSYRWLSTEQALRIQGKAEELGFCNVSFDKIDFDGFGERVIDPEETDTKANGIYVTAENHETGCLHILCMNKTEAIDLHQAVLQNFESHPDPDFNRLVAYMMDTVNGWKEIFNLDFVGDNDSLWMDDSSNMDTKQNVCLHANYDDMQ